eukprot:scaffold2449_cov18-Phaeocystis_antarctica.AAC.1
MSSSSMTSISSISSSRPSSLSSPRGDFIAAARSSSSSGSARRLRPPALRHRALVLGLQRALKHMQ